MNIPYPVRFISRFDLISSSNQSSSGVIIDFWMKSRWTELILVFSFLSVHDTMIGIAMIGILITISKSQWVKFCNLSLKLALRSFSLVPHEERGYFSFSSSDFTKFLVSIREIFFYFSPSFLNIFFKIIGICYILCYIIDISVGDYDYQNCVFGCRRQHTNFGLSSVR